MNKKEAAAALDGCEIRKEGSKELFEEMRQNQLVAVFGASDDLMEFRGAIEDEEGAPGSAYVTLNDLLRNKCDNDLCPYFDWEKQAAREIEALWCDEKEGPICWTYRTDIPHETFLIYEDGEPWCRGIVFKIGV